MTLIFLRSMFLPHLDFGSVVTRKTGSNNSTHLDIDWNVRVARSGEEKKEKRRVAENAELIPLTELSTP
jgi:hypothetical protein